jgi:hypothetical protein
MKASVTMLQRSAAAVPVLLFVLVAASCDSADTRSSTEASASRSPRTASDILSEFEKERSTGHAEATYALAHELMNRYPTSPEAKQVAPLLPELTKAVNEAEEAKLARELADKWSFYSRTDSMTSRAATFATIKSENTVNFGFPYQGDQYGTLMIRDHPSYGRDVLFFVERGQLLCQSYQDCRIRVRFDEGPPTSWNAVAPEDNDSETIILRNAGRFIGQLRKAKLVRLQVAAYQQGAPVFEFEVGGFDYGRFQKGE